MAPEKTDDVFVISQRDKSQKSNRGGIGSMSIEVRKSANNSSHKIDSNGASSPKNGAIKSNVVSFALDELTKQSGSPAFNPMGSILSPEEIIKQLNAKDNSFNQSPKAADKLANKLSFAKNRYERCYAKIKDFSKLNRPSLIEKVLKDKNLSPEANSGIMNDYVCETLQNPVPGHLQQFPSKLSTGCQPSSYTVIEVNQNRSIMQPKINKSPNITPMADTTQEDIKLSQYGQSTQLKPGTAPGKNYSGLDGLRATEP